MSFQAKMRILKNLCYCHEFDGFPILKGFSNDISYNTKNVVLKKCCIIKCASVWKFCITDWIFLNDQSIMLQNHAR